MPGRQNNKTGNAFSDSLNLSVATGKRGASVMSVTHGLGKNQAQIHVQGRNITLLKH
jgi:hypothetical protein